jgi:hypothetical protein
MIENKWNWIAGECVSSADFCIGAFKWNYAENEDSPVQLKIKALFDAYPKVDVAVEQL